MKRFSYKKSKIAQNKHGGDKARWWGRSSFLLRTSGEWNGHKLVQQNIVFWYEEREDQQGT